jgi:hypothetical protein
MDQDQDIAPGYSTDYQYLRQLYKITDQQIHDKQDEMTINGVKDTTPSRALKQLINQKVMELKRIHR